MSESGLIMYKKGFIGPWLRLYSKRHNLTHVSPILPSKELCHYRFYPSLCGVAGLAAQRENFFWNTKIFA